MEKRVLDRRLDLLAAEGVVFRTRVNVGVDVTAQDLQRDFDAVLLAGGAGRPRDLNVPGRELEGRPLRDGLPDAAEPPLPGRRTRRRADHRPQASTSSSSAAATPAPIASAPFIARVRRRSASSSCCPRRRSSGRPTIRGRCGRTSSAPRRRMKKAAIASTPLRPPSSPAMPTATSACSTATASSARLDGRVTFEPVADSAFEMKADLVLLAMGFVGPEKSRLLTDLDVRMSDRGTVVARRAMDDERARRVRRRRHAARPIADRLGDRRRPPRGCGDRRLSRRISSSPHQALWHLGPWHLRHPSLRHNRVVV